MTICAPSFRLVLRANCGGSTESGVITVPRNMPSGGKERWRGVLGLLSPAYLPLQMLRDFAPWVFGTRWTTIVGSHAFNRTSRYHRSTVTCTLTQLRRCLERNPTHTCHRTWLGSYSHSGSVSSIPRSDEVPTPLAVLELLAVSYDPRVAYF